MASEAELMQAVETVKAVREDFRAHVVKFDAHVEGQGRTNQAVQSQIFETRLEVKDVKKDVALVSQSLGEIVSLLKDKKMTWQFWVGISIPSLIGLGAILVSIFKE